MPGRRDRKGADPSAWLAKRGVSKKNVKKFLNISGCDTVDSMALYLRLQLSPLDLANTDCINLEMKEVMGVTGRRAKLIIKDLNVFDALDLDIHDAATTHLIATGTIGIDNHALNPSNPTTPTSVKSPDPKRVDSAPGRKSTSKTFKRGHLSPLPGDKEMCTPWSVTGGCAAEPHNPKAIHEPNPGDGGPFALRPSVSTEQQVADGKVVEGQIELPTSAKDANDAFANPMYRTFGAISGGGRSGSTVANGEPSALSSMRSGGNGPATLGESGGFLSAASSYLKTPYHSYMSAQVDASASHPPMSTGNPLHPFSVSELPGEQHHVQGDIAEAGPPCGSPTPPAARTYYDAVDSVMSLPMSGSGLGRSKGMPTFSHAFEPGPYHHANVQLRKQLPHYNAQMRVVTHWDQVLWCFLAISTFTIYTGVRIFYLVSGRTASISGQDVNVAYSWCVLIAEFFMSSCGFYSNQLFWKQETSTTKMTQQELAALEKDVLANGVKQTVHVMVCTYNETAELVRECVLRLLVAPEPIYMEKIIYVCDDGHSKSEGPKKRAMVEQLQALGHNNVMYVGDRIKKPGTLNGKSANLNHVIFRKIYPHARRPEHIPEKDIFMVMDCDHMAKPDIYNRMAPFMMEDQKMAVVLVPQSFFNLIIPDSFDTAGKDFTFIKMPFCFGASIVYITGTNFFLRARAAFSVSRFMEVQTCKDASSDCNNGSKALSDRNAPPGIDLYADVPMIFAEDQVSEDIDLGSRLHAAGFKAVFLAERLATGETPLDPRGMWRQRLRWFKGGHLFLFSKNSVFFKKDNQLTLYHKALYFFGPITHVVMFFFEPVISTLPFMCLVLRICPYGMDPILFWTHFAHIGISFMAAVYDRSLENILTGICAKGSIRILYFTALKACFNSVMVWTGFKKPGAFKITRKAGDMTGGEDGRAEADEQFSVSTADDSKVKKAPSSGSAADRAGDSGAEEDGAGGSGDGRGLDRAGRVISELSLRNSALDLPSLSTRNGVGSPGRVDGAAPSETKNSTAHQRRAAEAAGAAESDHRGWQLTDVHRGISKVTNVRRKFMPLDGTLDIWVLMLRVLISMSAAVVGTVRLARRDGLISWEPETTLIWLAISFAIVDATPGLLYFGYLLFYSWAPQLLKVYSPLVLAVVVGGVTFIELRVVAGFVYGV